MVDNISRSRVVSLEVSRTVLRDASIVVFWSAGSPEEICPGLWWAAIPASWPCSEEVAILETQIDQKIMFGRQSRRMQERASSCKFVP